MGETPVQKKAHMLKKLLHGICLLLAGVACSANQSSSGFLVLVNLNPQTSAFSQGVCINQSLSEKTNAVVRVVCGSGQFVSITANPNARFLGTHGGAFRYVLSPATIYSNSQSIDQGSLLDFYPGSGTVTAWHVYNVDGSEKLLEVLLTF